MTNNEEFQIRNEKNLKTTNLGAFALKYDAVKDGNHLVIVVSDETDNNNIGHYFENGTLSFPTKGRIICHLIKGNKFYIDKVDKSEPYNHKAYLLTLKKGQKFPKIKKGDIFLDAGFVVPE